MADDILPYVLSEATQSLFLAMAALLSAAIINWWIIIPSGISIFFYFLIGRIYLVIIPKLTRIVGIGNTLNLSVKVYKRDEIKCLQPRVQFCHLPRHHLLA